MPTRSADRKQGRAKNFITPQRYPGGLKEVPAKRIRETKPSGSFARRFSDAEKKLARGVQKIAHLPMRRVWRGIGDGWQAVGCRLD
jgi:hypothetical protein